MYRNWKNDGADTCFHLPASVMSHKLHQVIEHVLEHCFHSVLQL